MPAPPVIAAVADGDVLTETRWNTGPVALDSWMGNPPSAVLAQTVAQSIPNNAATSISFDRTIRDNYSGHRSAGLSGDAYYAPAAGVYLVQATVNLNWTGASGKAVGAYLILSSATTWAVVEGPATPAPVRFQFALAALIPMTATDFVQLRLFQNSGAAKPTGTTDVGCRMSARWIAL